MLSVALIGAASADIPKPSDVPPLIKQLTNSNSPAKMRAEAAKELGRIGQIKASYVKDAIPILLKAAKDKNDDVRRESLVALGFSNPDAEQAVPVLVEGLKSSNEQVQVAAAEALGYLGGEASEALPELRQLQRDLNGLSMEEKKKKRNAMRAVQQAIQSIQGRERKKK
jgi:HEAT repeat protein